MSAQLFVLSFASASIHVSFSRLSKRIAFSFTRDLLQMVRTDFQFTIQFKSKQNGTHTDHNSFYY